MRVSLLSTGHDVADARLHREAAALRDAGVEVEVRALGAEPDAPAGCAFRSVGTRAGLVVRAARALRLPWTARGDVLVVLDPELVLPALLATRVRRRRLVVDVHEDYLALLADRGWARGPAGVLARVLMRLVVRASAAADLVCVADEHVPPRAARHRLVVRNAVRAPLEPHERDGLPRAVYVGDLRSSRGLHAMVSAVEAAPGWTIDLIGPVAAADEAWALSHASDRVRFHGRQPPERAWAIARGAWVGMALLEDTPAFRAALPTKLFEYLGAGFAVLVSPLPRMVELVESSGSGVVARDVETASDTLLRWSKNPAELDGMRAAARAWAAEHLAGTTPFDRLAAEVQRLASTRGAA